MPKYANIDRYCFGYSTIKYMRWQCSNRAGSEKQLLKEYLDL